MPSLFEILDDPKLNAVEIVRLTEARDTSRRDGHHLDAEAYAGALQLHTDRAVYSSAPGMPYPEMKFSLIHADERREMENLERMLQKAFAAGDAHARKEIRDVLGIAPR